MLLTAASETRARRPRLARDASIALSHGSGRRTERAEEVQPRAQDVLFYPKGTSFAVRYAYPALERCLQLFYNFREEQYDFHLYSLRRTMLGSYVACVHVVLQGTDPMSN